MFEVCIILILILYIAAWCIFMVIPILVLYFFFVSLSAYRAERRKQKNDPASVSAKELSLLKWRLILSTVLVVVLAAFYVTLLFLPAGDIAYM